MRELIILPTVRLDIYEIWDFIALDNVDAAEKVIEEIQQAFQGLHMMPGKGHLRKDLTENTRFWSVRNYMIMYVHDDVTVTILRVMHGNRNIGRFFGRN